MPYVYDECGLRGIVLVNGYTEHDTPYGKGISIDDPKGLHRAIGLHLISNKGHLTGAELRFLRVDLDMTQKTLAMKLGASEQAVQRWERYKDKVIDGTADRLVRTLYREAKTGTRSVSRFVDEIASLGDNMPDMRFAARNNVWTPDRLAA